MGCQPMNDHWFADHANLVILVNWMADNDYDAKDIAYAVEKPWKYTDEYIKARGELS